MHSFDMPWEGVEYHVEWTAQDGCAWVELITFGDANDIECAWSGLTPENARVWERAQKRAEDEYGDMLADSHTDYGAW